MEWVLSPVLMSTKALNYLTTFQKTNDEWFFKKSLNLADKVIELSEEKKWMFTTFPTHGLR